MRRVILLACPDVRFDFGFRAQTGRGADIAKATPLTQRRSPRNLRNSAACSSISERTHGPLQPRGRKIKEGPDFQRQVSPRFVDQMNRLWGRPKRLQYQLEAAGTALWI